MADDSIEIVDPFEFHPCDTPRGCLYYNTSVLTDDQQYKLNDFKNNVIRSDQKYLKRHPQVRAFVALIMRYVFKKRPRKDVHLIIREFFSRPAHIIQDEVNEYLISHNLVYEEEEEEIEEELPGEYRFGDYYVFRDFEEEAEEEAEEVKKRRSRKGDYSGFFSYQPSAERAFISEFILQQIGQFPRDIDEYEGEVLYEGELSKTHTGISFVHELNLTESEFSKTQTGVSMVNVPESSKSKTGSGLSKADVSVKIRSQSQTGRASQNFTISDEQSQIGRVSQNKTISGEQSQSQTGKPSQSMPISGEQSKTGTSSQNMPMRGEQSQTERTSKMVSISGDQSQTGGPSQNLTEESDAATSEVSKSQTDKTASTTQNESAEN